MVEGDYFYVSAMQSILLLNGGIMVAKFYTKSFMLLKMLLLTTLIIMSLAACKKQTVDSYYSIDSTAGSALIEAAELKKYIDNGYKTNDGKKVVILHVTLQNGKVPETTIKGAYSFSQEEYLMEKRSDGVAPNGAMVASGAKVDKFLSKYGIDNNTLIVLTSHDLTNQMVYRTFWALKYWGFSNKALKVLNGANYYFFGDFAKENNIADIASYKSAPADISKITPSTFSVRDLPGNYIDSVRAPFGEVIEYAKAGKMNSDASGEVAVLSTIDAKKPVKSNGQVVTYTIYDNNAVDGRIKGATQLAYEQVKNGGYATHWALYLDAQLSDDGKYTIVGGKGTFKKPEQIRAMVKGLTENNGKTTNNSAFLGNIDKNPNKRLIFHCYTGRTTSPHWFVFREILGYQNAAVYDGSWQEWSSYSAYTPADAANAAYARILVGEDDPNTYDKQNTDYIFWNGSKFVMSDNKTEPELEHENMKTFIEKWDVTKYTDFATLGVESYYEDDEVYFYPLTNPNIDTLYAGDAKEINKEDKAYQGK